MMGQSIQNVCLANNATFLSALLLLAVTTSGGPSLQCCLARSETHRRPPPTPPDGPHHPPAAPVMTPPPSPSATFSVVDYGAVGDGVTDDTKAFADAWSAACAAEASTVLVPASYVFLVGPIAFTGGDSCEPNVVFQVDGTILANTGSTAWRSGYATQWLEFKSVRGLTIQGCGVIDGQGSHWWSRNPLVDQGQTTTELDPDRVGTIDRPTALRVYQGDNVTVTGITIRSSPKFHLTLDTCRAVEVHGVTIASPGDSPNTDGIHLASSVGVSIHHTTIACGDDCVSIQAGCSDVSIRNVYCGPGHGISVGGLGKGGATATVSDVTVQDVTFNHTMTGVRIKTWQGGSGSVKNVRFSGVRVSAVKTPIVIDQYYCDHTACTNQTSAVAVVGAAYQGVAGTYTQRPVYLACSDAAPCSGIHLADIQLQPVKDSGYRVQGPFCWKAHGDEMRPVEPPVDCLITAGAP
ncbi:polygalacturonase At1g48100 isoform X2 [Zea mays]|uniref:Polygalacturonase n=1 Tax=Zea mays TaxID=4577 RepID=A0A804R4G1_MAIZE|nr:polygalacturonase At1g48100 isoform X2 [Zea mays]|eukprot:XP_008659542.2 polygalacturonase At1g48100 isoform X2 [Zea mays]